MSRSMATCLFSGCPKGDILTSDGRVEVKTVLPKPPEMKKLKSKLLINWKRNGESVFHKSCWDELLKSARARKIHTKLPKLVPGEKILLLEAAKTAEIFDPLDSLKENALKCAKLIKSAKHCTVFTGAGISTSAGIGDYRGKSGKWTQMDQDGVNMDGVFGDIQEEEGDGPTTSKVKKEEENYEDEECDEDQGGVSYESLRPTYTHEALSKLMEDGYLKYVISQNCDGLHQLSGISQDRISELHGNVFIERCEKCPARYERKAYVMNDAWSHYYEEIEDYGRASMSRPSAAKKCPSCGLCHRTGRHCDKCGGHLIDTIINFGDNLEEDILDRAVQNAKQSDLMLCLGSTLTVHPANSLVEMTMEPHNLAICNRQKTHMDRHCGEGVRVFGDCDIFMREVMRGVLLPDELTTWEENRVKRMQHYDSLR